MIKFNCANEFAVNLFAEKKINFGNIHYIIANSLSLDLKSQVNNVKNIIDFQNKGTKTIEKIEFITKLKNLEDLGKEVKNNNSNKVVNKTTILTL